MKNFKIITLSTYLTLIRLLGAPFLVPFFIVQYGLYNDLVINLYIATLFLFFGITDFLDGFFARRYGQESKLGAALDHLADKVLVFSACIALVSIDKMNYFVAILLIGRELLIMGLREIALEHEVSLRVSSLGKLKTVIHIVSVTWVIVNPMQGEWCCLWSSMQVFLLSASLIVSWGSAGSYFMVFYKSLKK